MKSIFIDTSKQIYCTCRQYSLKSGNRIENTTIIFLPLPFGMGVVDYTSTTTWILAIEVTAPEGCKKLLLSYINQSSS